MRDHTKLRAFHLADELAIRVYRCSAAFPSQERFGLVAQMRRAAVSVASNIVEGCARDSHADYVHFLTMAYGSARELQYQVSLSRRLGFLKAEADQLEELCRETTSVLNALIRSLRQRE